MASHGSSSGEPKKEDSMTVALILMGCVGVIVILLWNATSVKIVKIFTPKLVTAAKSWLWIPGDAGLSSYESVVKTAQTFLQNPKKVSLLDWIPFFNQAMFIPCLLVTLLLCGMLARLMLKKTVDVKRDFKPQHLTEHMSHVFTGTAPILHLRKLIAQDKEPYWRRQLFPHEALLNVKIGGKPMIMDDKIVPALVQDYFRGIIMKPGPNGQMVADTINGRLNSRMLGRQVVDLLTDRGKSPCFPDRFSHTGKVIYALLCAHAFGGDEGKKDYAKARDQLNNSARGVAHGFCNLTVVQWLYDKYRNNPTARKLFAIHHWEHTYLYELLVQAKRQGKCGHWEYIWLKPMNRILFYTQNTVGRLTPHTESAATFAQYIYERRVARRGRLPLYQLPTGGYAHMIYIEKAVKGLSIEWDRWRDGEEDDNLWWSDPSIWERLSGIRLDPPAAPPPLAIVETAFDQMMTGQAHEKAKEEEMAARTAAVAAAQDGGENANW